MPKSIALLLCHDIDKGPLGGLALIDLITAAKFKGFPADAEFRAYFEVADGHGVEPLRFKFVAPQGEVIAESQFDASFPTSSYEYFGHMECKLRFHYPGLYRFQMWCQEELLSERTLRIELVQTQ